ncbi:uncharacterized protein LOC105392453 [Plutella xylostella]|uniref:uncharacterized protein LOC105392453 n=1 Tax=Plutella xylostella TaxID=51655 RepID=UPI0020322ECA|nr:uncharacterized protein LOC105392453 [Plutella xylostella]
MILRDGGGEAMRRAARWALIFITVSALLGRGAAQLPPADAPSNDTRCGPECLRCGAGGCVKCPQLLVLPGGACADRCPAGSQEAWAHDDLLMGRVCYPGHGYNELIIGGACGLVLCIALVASVAAYARCRSARPQPQPLPQRRDDDAMLRDFHKQLDCLRPHAYTLLSILNHTRHQVRELYQMGNNEAAVAYSCVLSDLAKLLILLNKQCVPVVPEEWPRLACWADRILKRYGRLGHDEQGPVVNYLPSPSSQGSDSETTQQSFSTFKPPSYSSRSFDPTLDKDSQSEWSDVGRPPSYSQIERERESIVLSDPWERRPIVRRESVWLEDEIFENMRRPQDELTTEL